MMARDTWFVREMPMLAAIAAIEEKGDPHTDQIKIVEATGLGGTEVAPGLLALHDGDYLTGVNPRIDMGGWFRLDLIRLLEGGRVATDVILDTHGRLRDGSWSG